MLGSKNRATVTLAAAALLVGGALVLVNRPASHADTATRPEDIAGLLVDNWGGLHTFSEGMGAPPTFSGGPYWPGQNVARGVAAAVPPPGPQFPRQGGVVVDDWGGLHPFRINGSPLPSNPTGGPYWPGQDIARGVALVSNGAGGYVLDDWGGLHPFALNGTMPAAPNNVAYWPGKDVARGVAVDVGGTGGYTVDLWGGIHPFGIGANPPPRMPTSGPYWPGQDAARGITLLPDESGGYIGDSWGGFHGFDLFGRPIPAPPTNGPYWPGQNVAWGPANTSSAFPTTTTSISTTSSSTSSSTTTSLTVP